MRQVRQGVAAQGRLGVSLAASCVRDRCKIKPLIRGTCEGAAPDEGGRERGNCYGGREEGSARGGEKKGNTWGGERYKRGTHGEETGGRKQLGRNDGVGKHLERM